MLSFGGLFSLSLMVEVARLLLDVEREREESDRESYEYGVVMI